MLGQLFYMVYILQIGGDFMHGRFFAILTFISVGQIIIGFSIIKQISIKTKNLIIIGFLFVTLSSNFVLDYPVFSNTEYTYRTTIFDSIVSHSPPIYDLRAEHYHTKGLFAKKRESWPIILKNSSVRPEEYRDYLCKTWTRINKKFNRILN